MLAIEEQLLWSLFIFCPNLSPQGQPAEMSWLSSERVGRGGYGELEMELHFFKYKENQVICGDMA